MSQVKKERAMKDEKYKRVVEDAAVGIYEVKFDPPCFVWVNKEVCRALEYAEEELLEMNPFDFTDEAGRRLFLERFSCLLGGEKVAPSAEFKLKTKNGKDLWILLHAALTKSNNVLDGALVLAQDITERRKAEDELKQSEERFSKIFHSNPAAIVISHYDDGRIIDVNKTFLRLSGYTYEEVIGHTSNELKLFQKPADRNQISNLLQKQAAISNREMTFRAKNGELKEVLFSTEIIRIGSEDCIISTVLDVTERRKLEMELEKYTKNLENVVKERTEKLKDAERLAAIGATAGMVGHDIRNPLQAILGDLYLQSTATSFSKSFVD